MADPLIISTLEDKLHELRASIVTYEERLEQARQELAVMTTALTIFQRDGGRITDTRPATVRNLFKRGEVIGIARKALADTPEGLTTRELGVCCLMARGFNQDDPVLLRAMVGLLSNTLKKAVRRGEMIKVVEDGRKAVWRTGLAAR